MASVSFAPRPASPDACSDADDSNGSVFFGDLSSPYKRADARMQRKFFGATPTQDPLRRRDTILLRAALANVEGPQDDDAGVWPRWLLLVCIAGADCRADTTAESLASVGNESTLSRPNSPAQDKENTAHHDSLQLLPPGLCSPSKLASSSPNNKQLLRSPLASLAMPASPLRFYAGAPHASPLFAVPQLDSVSRLPRPEALSRTAGEESIDEMSDAGLKEAEDTNSKSVEPEEGERTIVLPTILAAAYDDIETVEEVEDDGDRADGEISDQSCDESVLLDHDSQSVEDSTLDQSASLEEVVEEEDTLAEDSPSEAEDEDLGSELAGLDDSQLDSEHVEEPELSQMMEVVGPEDGGAAGSSVDMSVVIDPEEDGQVSGMSLEPTPLLLTTNRRFAPSVGVGGSFAPIPAVVACADQTGCSYPGGVRARHRRRFRDGVASLRAPVSLDAWTCRRLARCRGRGDSSSDSCDRYSPTPAPLSSRCTNSTEAALDDDLLESGCAGPQAQQQATERTSRCTGCCRGWETTRSCQACADLALHRLLDPEALADGDDSTDGACADEARRVDVSTRHARSQTGPHDVLEQGRPPGRRQAANDVQATHPGRRCTSQAGTPSCFLHLHSRETDLATQLGSLDVERQLQLSACPPSVRHLDVDQRPAWYSTSPQQATARTLDIGPPSCPARPRQSTGPRAHTSHFGWPCAHLGTLGVDGAPTLGKSPTQSIDAPLHHETPLDCSCLYRTEESSTASTGSDAVGSVPPGPVGLSTSTSERRRVVELDGLHSSLPSTTLPSSNCRPSAPDPPSAICRPFEREPGSQVA